MTVEARRPGFALRFLVAPPGHRNDGRAGTPRLLPDVTANVVSAQGRQPDIQQDQVGPEVVRRKDGFATVVDHAHVMA